MVLLTSYGTIAAIGLLGNGLVILVILKYTKMKTVTNMYILNLSIADTLFLIGLPLIMATYALKHWIFGFTLCKLYYISTCINQFTGAFTLTVMSGDRFLAVCYPIESMQYRTPKYARITIALIWILSFLFMLPVVLYGQIIPQHNNPSRYSCTIKWPTQDETTGGNIFITYTLILGFLIPVVMISLLYTLLVIRLKTTGPQVRTVHRKSSHRKVTRLVTLIIAIFIICWLPYWVFQVVLITVPEVSRQPKILGLYHGFTMLSYSNSMINPLLYAFTNESFRGAFISTFKCVADTVQRHDNKTNIEQPENREALNIGDSPRGKVLEKTGHGDSQANWNRDKPGDQVKQMAMVHLGGNGITTNYTVTETSCLNSG